VKIAQVCTFDIHGGAARASYRLHRGMIALGQESLLLVLDKTSTDDTVRQLHAGPAADEFAVRCLRGIQRHYIDANRTPISNTLFSLPYPGYDLTALDEIVTADVINLHWVALLQSPVTIRGLLGLGKPVVWTLHDMWAFTGGCHYSSGCHRYEEDCFPCPQLDSDPCRLPAAVLDDKIEAIGGPRLVVVTPSKWLAGCARRSRLFRNARVEVIPYSLETDTFAPLPKREAKRRLGLGPDTVTLLMGAHDGRERRKGFTQLAQALRICVDDLQFRGWVRQDTVRLLWFGIPPDEFGPLPVPVVPLSGITSDEKLREIYCAADVYVLPSLEDNLPNAMLEAMSCGTPVVAFGAGGIPEIVIDGLTGRVVSTGDAGQLGAAILDCLRDREACAKMGEAGRRVMEAGHAIPVQARRYLDLYAELLRAGGPGPRPRRTGGGASPAAETPAAGPVAIDGVAVPPDVGIGLAFERIFAEASFPAARVAFEELSARLGDAQAELERSRATIAAREDELGEARAELDQSHAEIQGLRGRIADKEGELGKARVELDQSHAEAQGLRGRIAAMESTKFWKLRTVWFRLKRVIGLPGPE